MYTFIEWWFVGMSGTSALYNRCLCLGLATGTDPSGFDYPDPCPQH